MRSRNRTGLLPAVEHAASAKTHDAARSPARARKPVVDATAAKSQVAAKQIGGAASQPGSKLVRDSFTIPKAEYAILEGLKLRATNLKRPTKKGEILRAGVSSLHAMKDKDFLAALERIPSLKTGRPKRLAGGKQATPKSAAAE